MEADPAGGRAADLARQLEAAHAQLLAMREREEERRVAAAEERKQQVMKLWLSFDQQVMEKEQLWQHGAAARAAAKWRTAHVAMLSRPRLELDLLRAMAELRPAAAMFKPLQVARHRMRACVLHVYCICAASVLHMCTACAREVRAPAGCVRGRGRQG